MIGHLRLAVGRLSAVLVFASIVACGGCGHGGSNQFTIGGSVSGLAGSGLVLQNSAGGSLAVSANGNFTFSGSAASGSPYGVTVATQPVSPSQFCTVANGSGTVTSGNVTNVAVTCANTYALGGVVRFLFGSGLVLKNGDSTATVSADGTFSFNDKVATGSAYAVTVSSQPTGPGQMCTAMNGSGTMATSDVNNVTVRCVGNTARFAYVSGHSGVFCYSIDQVTGALTSIGASPCAAGLLNGFATEPRGKFGYAADGTGVVHSYSIDPSSGALTELAGGDAVAEFNPVDVHVDPSGRFVYVANYGAGISGYSIDPASGHLTAVPGSPFSTAPNPNRVTVDASARFVYVANNDVHGMKGVSGFTIDSNTGSLTPIAGSPYGTPNWATDVALNPAATFAFATIPDENAVAVFAIDSMTGVLTPIEGSPFPTGTSPDGVVVDLTGSFLYVANSSDGTISGYAINPTTGALTPLAGSPYPCPGLPNYLSVNPRPGFLVVSNGGNSTVGTYSIDPQTGVLAQVPGSPAPAVGGSTGIYSISFAP